MTYPFRFLVFLLDLIRMILAMAAIASYSWRAMAMLVKEQKEEGPSFLFRSFSRVAAPRTTGLHHRHLFRHAL